MKIAEGLKATCSIASNRPSLSRRRVAFGPSWMPAPVSSRKSERSSTVAVKSCRASASAAVSPPIPPPAIRYWLSGVPLVITFRLGRGRTRWRGRHIDASRRVTLSIRERCIVQKERRAIGADDLLVIPHVEINVGVVGGRARAHALKFLDADLDLVDALVVYEMRHQRLRHDPAVSRSSRWRRA